MLVFLQGLTEYVGSRIVQEMMTAHKGRDTLLPISHWIFSKSPSAGVPLGQRACVPAQHEFHAESHVLCFSRDSSFCALINVLAPVAQRLR